MFTALRRTAGLALLCLFASGLAAPTAAQAPATAPTLTPGDGQIQVSWDVPSDPVGAAIVSDLPSYRVEYRSGSSGDWIFHSSGDRRSAVITGLTNGQSYQVGVTAIGAWDEYVYAVVSATPAAPNAAPAAPAAPTLTPGNRRLRVAWAAPASGGAVSDYDLQYRRSGGGWTDHSHSGVGRSAVIAGLTNGQAYEVQVLAKNSVGSSGWSASASNTPTAQAPDAPRPPELTRGNEQLGVSWSAPATNGAAINDYDVRYKRSSDTAWTDHSHNGTGTSTTITNLANGTDYDVQVRASNSAGPGPWSNSMSGTPATIPAAPDAPTLTPGENELRVAWTEPDSGGTLGISYYDVRHKRSSDTAWTVRSRIGSLSTTISGLTNGQAYEVQVRAKNSVGSSGWSLGATGAPGDKPDGPDAPALVPGDGQLSVSWEAPAAYGAAISDYDVRYRAGNSGPWTNANYTGTGTSTTISGLTNGQSYQVQVRATNSIGTGDWSPSASAAPATVPAAPAAPALTPGNGQLRVAWAAPAANGAAINDYDVRYKLSGDSGWTDHPHSGVGRSAVIAGLINGQAYDVQVLAKNSVGSSGWSPSATGTPAPEAPAAPAAPRLTTAPGQLAVSWATPANNGAAITDYDVRYKLSGDDDWTDHPHSGAGRSKTIAGLTNGQIYQVQVRARNSAGWSGWSPGASAAPVAVSAAPAAPALTPGNGQLRVAWAAPAANGAAISDYDLRYKRSGDSGWTDHPHSGVGRSAVIAGLINGQAYDVQVLAKNSIGSSDWSQSASAAPATEPAAPAAPALTPGNGQLRVAWAAPAANGAAISDYDVRYKLSGDSGWTDHPHSGVGRSAVIAGLINGQAYDVQVLAKNSVGSSGWSPSATGTPAPEAPAAPAAPRLTTAPGQLAVSWATPANNGAAITDYDVRYKLSGDDDWTDHPHSGAGRSKTIAGLINGQAYDVQVLAKNSVGSSDWSQSASATPAQAQQTQPVNANDDAGPDVPFGGSVTIQTRTLLANDVDERGRTGSDEMTVSAVSNPQRGTVTLNADGRSIAFAHDGSGADLGYAFTYTLMGIHSATTDTAVVTGAVAAAVPPPTITSFTASAVGKTVTLNWALSGGAPDTLTLGYSGPDGPDPGVEVTGTTHLATLTKAGDYTFFLTATNAGGSDQRNSNMVTVKPKRVPPPPRNRAPVANDDGLDPLIEVVRGGSVLVRSSALLANDTDADGDALSVAKVVGATGGTAVLAADGDTVTFTHDGKAEKPTFAYRADDGRGGTDTATVTITVTAPANRPPTAVAVAWVAPAAGGRIAEDADTGSGRVKVAELSATDPDDDAHAFAASDAATFETDGAALYLRRGAALDHETAPSLPFTVTATDAGGLGVTSAELTLTVTDANEAPTAVAVAWVAPAAGGRIAEDADTGAGRVKVAELSATDPDDDAHAFAASDAATFETDGAALYLRRGAALDHETAPSLPFTVTATDAGGLGVTSAELTLTVTDANEAPTAVAVAWVAPAAGGRIAEDVDTGAGRVKVAELSATDPDDDAHAFAVSDAATFETDGAALYIRRGAALDHETAPSLPFTVTATDGGGLGVETEAVLQVDAETEATARARLERVNEAILPELTRALTAGAVEALERRVAAASGSGASSAAPPARNLEQLLWNQAPALRDGRWQQALGNSSFAMPLSGGSGSGGSRGLTLWGGGDYRSLSGDGDAAEWDGDVLSARIGLDARVREDLLAGLAVSWSRGDFDYTDRGHAGHLPIDGTHESEMLGLHPYVGWTPRENLSLWGALGYGTGEVTLRDDGAGRRSSDAEQTTAAVGGRSRLFSDGGLIEGGATALNLKGELWASRFKLDDDGLIDGVSADAWRLRLGLEGTHEHRLSGGGRLTPSVELGVRHDGGDGETGAGVELGGGLAWTNPARGLRVEGFGRALLAHEGDVDEWGAGGLVMFMPDPGGRGLSFSLRPTWGMAAGGIDRLWNDRAGGSAGPYDARPASGRLETQVGYGLGAGGGLLTPFGGMALHDGGARRYRLGGLFEVGRSLTMSLELERREGAGQAPDHGFMLRLRYAPGGADRVPTEPGGGSRPGWDAGYGLDGCGTDGCGPDWNDGRSPGAPDRRLR